MGWIGAVEWVDALSFNGLWQAAGVLEMCWGAAWNLVHKDSNLKCRSCVKSLKTSDFIGFHG